MYNRTNEVLSGVSEIAKQQQYLELINYRDSKVNDTKHREVVLSGYMKILNLMQRAIR